MSRKTAQSLTNSVSSAMEQEEAGVGPDEAPHPYDAVRYVKVFLCAFRTQYMRPSPGPRKELNARSFLSLFSLWRGHSTFSPTSNYILDVDTRNCQRRGRQTSVEGHQRSKEHGKSLAW